MFVGHFALGFAAKRIAPKTPLPLLFAAPQVADLLWPIFIATGLERAHLQPGHTAASPLVLDYIPYSHSLVALSLWGVLVGGLYWLARRDLRGAWVLGALVLSHWPLDWITHVPDMPIFRGEGPLVGLGLWNSIPGTLIVELGLWAAGIAVYLRATTARDRIGSIGLYVFLGVLTIVHVGQLLGPPPPSLDVVKPMPLLIGAMMAVVGWIERHRSTQGSLALQPEVTP